MLAAAKTSAPFLDDAARIEFGDVITQRARVADHSKVIVASYNIRYAVGPYLISSGLSRRVGYNPPRPRTARVADNIATAARAFTDGSLLPAVDILALQEADKLTGRAGGHHVTRELAHKLEMNWVHVPAGIPRGVPPQTRQWWLDFEEQIGLHDPGDTGVALLSRFPLEAVTRIDLPWHECPWRPRVALGATVSVGPHKLQIFNAHIDPHAAGSGLLEQVEVMLDQAESSTGPTIVMGDFNTLSKQKCIDTRSLLESRGYTTPFPTGIPTWRTTFLRMHADWIFVRNAEIKRWGVARPLNVSDHWPVWAEVALPNANCQLPISPLDATTELLKNFK